jgi:hypothetical protein
MEASGVDPEPVDRLQHQLGTDSVRDRRELFEGPSEPVVVEEHPGDPEAFVDRSRGGPSGDVIERGGSTHPVRDECCDDLTAGQHGGPALGDVTVNGPLKVETLQEVGDDQQGADISADPDHRRFETCERCCQRFELSRRFEVVLATQIGDHALTDPAAIPVGLDQFQVHVGLIAPFDGDTLSEHVVHTLPALDLNYKPVIATGIRHVNVQTHPNVVHTNAPCRVRVKDHERHPTRPGTQS